MQLVRRFALSGYVIFAPFTTWFAFSGWLRLPVDFLLLSLVLFLPVFAWRMYNKPRTFVINQEDWILMAMLGLITISFFFYSSGTLRSFNHLLSFVFAFVCYLILFKRMWLDSGFRLTHLFMLVMWTCLLSDAIVITEWILLNFFDKIIRTYFLYTEVVANMVYYNQIYYKSVGGVAEEPSLMAFNLNALFPIGLYYIQNRWGGWRFWAFMGLHLFALTCTASSGGIGFFIIAFTAAFLLEFKKEYWIAFGLLVFVGGLFGFIGFFFLPDNIQFNIEALFSQVVSKVTFNNVSAQMRTDAWAKGWLDFMASPWFGRGPGYGNEAYAGFGYQSTYVKIAAELGIWSLLAFISFLIMVFVRVRTTYLPLRRYFTLAFLTFVMHWAIADAYYHISPWIAIALIQMVHWEKAEERKSGAVG